MVPARYLSEVGPLKNYVGRISATPYIADDQPAKEAVKAIIAEKSKLLRLGRNEAAVATGRWHAMTRITRDFEGLRTQITDHPLMQGVELPVPPELPVFENR